MAAPRRPHSGHLFVIDGDLTRLDCDAVLVPTDGELLVEPAWYPLLAKTPGRASRLEQTPPQGWGARVRATPYAASGDRPHVWLGAVGTDSYDEKWFADGALAFVERAADQLWKSWSRPVPPRVALNVVGAGRGGARHDKGHLFTTMIPALQRAAVDSGVDVVLVCYGSKQYAAAQRARCHLLGEQSATTRTQWDKKERPHRSLGLEPPGGSAPLRALSPEPSEIGRLDRLDGLIHEYYGKPA